MSARTLNHRLEQHCAAHPDAEFGRWWLGAQEIGVTYADLHRESGRIAALLAAQGITAGDIVLIVLPSGPELWFSFFGALRAGAVPSFMPGPSAKQDPVRYWASHEALFARIGRGAILTDADRAAALRQHLPEAPQMVIDLAQAAAFSPDQAPKHDAAPQDIALLQHSSGTTGLKKGVALSHDAIFTQLASYGTRLELQATDRIVSWLPLYHDMGLIACFLLPFVHGVPVVMLDPFEWVASPKRLLQAITRHRPTLLWQPNFAFHHLCRTVRPSGDYDLSSVRAWINCSEPCRAETFETFARRFAGMGLEPTSLQVCYAMAETVFAVTQTRPHTRATDLRVQPQLLREQHRVALAEPTDPDAQSFLSAGSVIDALAVTIVDAQGQALPPDHVGTIAITGACLFDGYHRLPEVTAQKFRDGRYLTGDLGFLHDGELYVVGREDDLIIVHGRNYTAHELEFLINQVPGVHPGRNVALGWFRREVGSHEVVVIAEFDQLLSPTRSPEELAADIRHELVNGSGLVPFDVLIVPPGWLVKTTSGKIARGANLEKYEAARHQPAPRPLPRAA